MHLIRLLILCLATVAMAAQPSRATPICPMQYAHEVAATLPIVDGGRAEAPSHHRERCPGPMACCTPIAAHVTAFASLVRPIWSAVVPTRAAAERDRDDAALDSLLRPPRSV